MAPTSKFISVVRLAAHDLLEDPQLLHGESEEQAFEDEAKCGEHCQVEPCQLIRYINGKLDPAELDATW